MSAVHKLGEQRISADPVLVCCCEYCQSAVCGSLSMCVRGCPTGLWHPRYRIHSL